MNKPLTTILAIMTSLLSAAACAAPGEYWEVTSKMEMPGMPFAMPATTTKVCIPKGGENDPSKTSGDKDCQMSDIKIVGNKSSWKVRCDHKGEVMTGSGEQTSTTNGYQGKMQFSGKSGGHDMNMNMAYSGKRIGGACDSEEAQKKAQEHAAKATAQLCDTSRYHSTADWINNSALILQQDSPCADQRKQLCELVRKDTPRDAQAYNALLMVNQQTGNNISIARECKLDMAASTKSICKTINGKNYSQLSAHCPAEAKAFREDQRRRGCEGRSYTAATKAEDFRKCMSGVNADEASDDSMQNEAPAPHKSGNTSLNNPAADVLEGAKKLKGIFGF